MLLAQRLLQHRQRLVAPLPRPRQLRSTPIVAMGRRAAKNALRKVRVHAGRTQWRRQR